MQPYLFPYIGYFQLINAVDMFVIYDDVNFIKQGWINRNKILLNGKEFLFTLKIDGASSYKKINEISVGKYNHKLLKTIEQGYKLAPYYHSVYPIIEMIILQKDLNLARYVSYSIKLIAEYLKLSTEFIFSSNIEKNNQLKSQEKVIEICRLLKADQYYNSIGGQELYSRQAFSKENINLRFLRTKAISYRQFDNNFVQGLSLIDVMMFNSVEEIKLILDEYELI